MDADEIAHYLRENPKFFEDYADVVAEIEVERKTGRIWGRRFTVAHDLPNESAYAETCAGIGLVFFAHRMLQLDCDSRYADVMERALYNGVMSGVSLKGDRFFYVNRLAVRPMPVRTATALSLKSE